MMSDSCNCPCCGSEIPIPIGIEILKELQLSPREKDIVGELTEAYPRAISMDRLCDLVYGSDVNPPEDERASIRVYVLRIRKKIKGFGWTVPVDRRWSSGYKLEKLER